MYKTAVYTHLTDTWRKWHI